MLKQTCTPADAIVLLRCKSLDYALSKLTTKFSEAVFTNPVLRFHEDKVISTAKIPRGETILIEHVLHLQNPEAIFNVTIQNREVFDDLHPRGLQWLQDKMKTSQAELDNFFDAVSQKSQKNIMTDKTDDGKLLGVVKGKKFARFASSSKFNTKCRILLVDIEWSRHQTTKYAAFVTVFAARDIEAGEELYTYAPLNDETDKECFAKFFEPIFNSDDLRDCFLMGRAEAHAAKCIQNYINSDIAAEILVNINMAWENVISSGQAVYYLHKWVEPEIYGDVLEEFWALQRDPERARRLLRGDCEADPFAKAESLMRNLLEDVKRKKNIKIPKWL